MIEMIQNLFHDDWVFNTGNDLDHTPDRLLVSMFILEHVSSAKADAEATVP